MSTEHARPPTLTLTQPSYTIAPRPSSPDDLSRAPTALPTPVADGDFDPLATSKVTSPFYQYAHESPRPSLTEPRSSYTHNASKTSVNIHVQDLELGEISPSVTQEKKDSLASHNKKRRWMIWRGRQECLTKPRQKSWLQRLPKKQRIIVNSVIALLTVGVMLAIALGIAAAVHSGIYGSSKTVGSSH